MLIGPYSILAYNDILTKAHKIKLMDVYILLRNIYTLQYNCEKMKMKNLYIWHMVLVWKNDIVGACMKFNIYVKSRVSYNFPN